MEATPALVLNRFAYFKYAITMIADNLIYFSLYQVFHFLMQSSDSSLSYGKLKWWYW